MQNQRHNNKGFTLVEIMIAMAVIVLVIFSSTTIVVSIIRSNTENVDTLIAYGLAQEGLEGLRNIRDSNWLLDAHFDGSIGAENVWGASFPTTTEVSYFKIDLAVLERSQLGVDTPGALSGTTPWKLFPISQDEAENMDETTRLLKLEDTASVEENGEVRYGHEVTLGSGEPMPFYRYVTVQNISEVPLKPDTWRMSSIVNWMESGRKKEVRLDTILTDWNKGQL